MVYEKKNAMMALSASLQIEFGKDKRHASIYLSSVFSVPIAG
jgi:hypothetical protein